MEGLSRIAATQSPSTSCAVCKSPSTEVTRSSFCSVCFNRKLERACHTTVLAGGTSRNGSGQLRIVYPGMPRAVLVPAKVQQHVTTPTCSQTRRAVSGSPGNVVETSNSNLDGLAPDHGTSNPNQRKAQCTDGNVIHSRAFPCEREELKLERARHTDKMLLFKEQKNLTLEIPKLLPTHMSPRRPRLQPLPAAPQRHTYTSLPPYQLQESLTNTMQASKCRKWTIRPDPCAEAQLMLRLLADSVPMLKSTAPIVLPPCKVRIAPVTPVSPPGDPLWKRRCIPLPQISPIATIAHMRGIKL